MSRLYDALSKAGMVQRQRASDGSHVMHPVKIPSDMAKPEPAETAPKLSSAVAQNIVPINDVATPESNEAARMLLGRAVRNDLPVKEVTIPKPIEAAPKLSSAVAQNIVPINEVATPEPTEAARMLLGRAARNNVPTNEVVENKEPCTFSVRPSVGSHLIALTDSRGLGAEKFRVLATRLQHLRKQHEFKSLQVTSSVVGEGKSLVSANLALTLAKYSSFKTLLIEGDLHRPTLTSLLGLGELQGLKYWWSGQDQDFSHYVHKLADMPLWFLSAGQAHEQASHVLQSERFAQAFAQLANQFDWIVVDSTPMLPIVDVNLWSRLVDGTLLVVRENVAPTKMLTKGLKAMDNLKLVGVVINDATDSEQSAYEGQYYGEPSPDKKNRRRK